MDFSKLPMEKLNNFLLAVGEANSETDFISVVLDGLQKFAPFDQGTVYFYDSNRKITHWRLQNVEDHWNEAYLEYYHQFSTDSGDHKPTFSIDWSKRPSDPTLEYIQERGILHSFYIRLHDENWTLRAIIAMDRLKDIPFSEVERQKLEFLAPHLNALYKRFVTSQVYHRKGGDRKLALMKMAGLTKQETRIALQLCAGVSPNNISKAFGITLPTTNKHISHIYKKMKVSNIQELLAYLLGSKDEFTK